MQEGDKVRLSSKGRAALQKTIPHDDILRRSRDTIYTVKEIRISGVTLTPKTCAEPGSDGKPHDTMTRAVFFSWLEIEDASGLDTCFDQVGDPTILVAQSSTPKTAFCSCDSPNHVKSFALGKEFLYCRSCKKEAQ